MEDSPKYYFIELSPQKASMIEECLHLHPSYPSVPCCISSPKERPSDTLNLLFTACSVSLEGKLPEVEGFSVYWPALHLP